MMSKLKIAGALAAAALALGGQGASADGKDSPSRRLELAREYMVVTRRTEDMAMSYGEYIRNAKTECPDKACVNDLAAAMQRAAGEEAPAYLEGLAQIWADVFTEQELADALAFAKSPSGRAMTAKAPLVTPREGALGARLQERIWARASVYFCRTQPQQCQQFNKNSRSDL